jgi:lysyl-tRNA synthetase class 1
MPQVMPFQVPFRHLCNLIQIADGDIEKALFGLGNPPDGPSPEQLPALRSRAKCAKYWVEECAPEEFRFKLKPAGEAPSQALSVAERAAIVSLRDNLIAVIENYTDDKS